MGLVDSYHGNTPEECLVDVAYGLILHRLHFVGGKNGVGTAEETSAPTVRHKAVLVLVVTRWAQSSGINSVVDPQLGCCGHELRSSSWMGHKF